VLHMVQQGDPPSHRAMPRLSPLTSAGFHPRQRGENGERHVGQLVATPDLADEKSPDAQFVWLGAWVGWVVPMRAVGRLLRALISSFLKTLVRWPSTVLAVM
jgi:hypothetical protein